MPSPPGQPDIVARWVAIGALIVGVLNFIWTWTRTRRKLTVKAEFVWSAPYRSDGPLAVSVSIRNPRKVSIGLKTAGVIFGDNKRNVHAETVNLCRTRITEAPSLGMTRELNINEEYETLAEGDESRHEFSVPKHTEKVIGAFVTDSKGFSGRPSGSRNVTDFASGENARGGTAEVD